MRVYRAKSLIKKVICCQKDLIIKTFTLTIRQSDGMER